MKWQFFFQFWKDTQDSFNLRITLYFFSVVFVVRVEKILNRFWRKQPLCGRGSSLSSDLEISVEALQPQLWLWPLHGLVVLVLLNCAALVKIQIFPVYACQTRFSHVDVFLHKKRGKIVNRCLDQWPGVAKSNFWGRFTLAKELLLSPFQVYFRLISCLFMSYLELIAPFRTS